ncbi:hypothetical protein GCM10023159_25050 [Brevibacterium yomogidense]
MTSMKITAEEIERHNKWVMDEFNRLSEEYGDDHIGLMQAMSDLTRVEPTGDTWDELCYMQGRNDLPQILHDNWDRLTPSEVAQGLCDAWSGCDWPEARVEPRHWIEMFESIGYTDNGKMTDPPTHPVSLYRGAPDDRKQGMAWTTSLATAQRFASGEMRESPRPGEVWTTFAEPHAILAKIDDRSEDEYVLHPDRVTVEKYV